MEKKNYLPINLQFFNDGGAEGNTGEEGSNEPKAMSFDEWLSSNKEYQSEFDKKIAKALETSKTKIEAEWGVKLEEAKNEATKLAKMTADEKAKHEQEKQLKALEERELAITRRELMAEAKNTLSEKGLPQGLAEVLNYATAEDCKKSIEAIETAFNEALEKAVEEKLRGGKTIKKPPKEVDDLEESIKRAMNIDY